MNKPLIPLIIAVQKMLIKKPYDLAHDIGHHYRVFINCQEIIKKERLEDYDKQILTICAWWHDIGGKKGGRNQELTDLLIRYNYSTLQIRKIVQIIKEHSFGEKQTSLESQILYDADKLEYVDPVRLEWFIAVDKENLIPKAKTKLYFREFEQRVMSVMNNLHFSYSRCRFKQMLPKAIKIMRDEKR